MSYYILHIIVISTIRRVGSCTIVQRSKYLGIQLNPPMQFGSVVYDSCESVVAPVSVEYRVDVGCLHRRVIVSVQNST